MKRILYGLVLPASLCLLAAAPARVQTSDYFGGYAGTHKVDPQVAARWLTWAETNIADSKRVAAAGIKAMLYTDPNRQISGEPLFTADESTFAHDCGGQRISTLKAGQYVMDVTSPSMHSTWKRHVQRYAGDGKFDAIFEDDAGNLAYTHAMPCNANAWIAATNAMQASLGYPVIYNGLSNFSGRTPPASLALNQTAIGGMMEECYATSPSQPKSGGDKWWVTEATELRMMQDRKLFFCYGNDTTAAASALDGRLYAYASFLLTYDPAYAVLWEYYQTPSGLHVMPESQLVPTSPHTPPQAIDDLRVGGGAYARSFGNCYLAGRSVGPCLIAVNPDTSPHPIPSSGYRRTLQISGGGVLDGGNAHIAGTAPPAVLQPLSAVIAFR